jgi:prepilin peptidase CpaA
MTIALALALCALACVLAAAIFDLALFEIPDSLSIALVATAIAYGLAVPGFGWISHIAAPLIVFGIGLFVFSRGWLGGGDVKVMSGIAAWTGLEGLAAQLVATSVAGGVLVLVLMGVRRGIAGAGVGSDGMHRLFRSDGPIPYAVAIAAGTAHWAIEAWPVS